MSDPIYHSLLEAAVRFDAPLRPWDGFGLNYVQACQTPDYRTAPQDYGGFNVLPADAVDAILDALFDGLRPGLIKMFLDPHHCPEPADGLPPAPLSSAFDHRTSTDSMRRFVRGGLERTQRRGDSLRILTTLYGPPGWVTRQRAFRGRDLDPARIPHLIQYFVSWLRFLKEQEQLPVAYVSLHNEGECWRRWTPDGQNLPDAKGHDYNMYWPPAQVAAFVPALRAALDQAGLPEVGVTCGETYSWPRFAQWGYLDALLDDPKALEALALITSHGFFNPWPHRWFGGHFAPCIDRLQAKKPSLRAWTTSTSFSKMDAQFAWELHSQITFGGVNAIIPWACCQRSNLWTSGDPNPGTAIRVHDTGTFDIEPGYYFYQPFCRAGQPGTHICPTSCNEGGLFLTAFSGRNTRHPDAFTLINCNDVAWPVPIQVRGARHRAFNVFVTSPTERFAPRGRFPLEDGKLRFDAPAGSVAAFFGCD